MNREVCVVEVERRTNLRSLKGEKGWEERLRVCGLGCLEGKLDDSVSEI